MKATADKNLVTFLTNLSAEERHDQCITDCPFCHKEGHFFFSQEFMWDCKVCGKSGNALTFIREFYETLPALANIEELVEAKRLPYKALTNLGIRYNKWNDTFIIPCYKEGKLMALYKYRLKSNRMYATPDMDHCLFNWPQHINQELWICEGHWDKVAADVMLVNAQDVTAVAVPGSNVFKPEWASILANRDIVLVYDNDEAGLAGRKRLIEKIIAESHHKPKSIRIVDWSGKPEKYDLRDCYIEHGIDALKYIRDHTYEYEPPAGITVTKETAEEIEADNTCTTFDDLISRFKEVYHVTSDMELALLLVLASIYSVKIDGEQLWVRLIGPPSCGKTTIANAVATSSQVVLRSTFTGLFSGWKDDSDDDAGLIPIIDGKTLLVKDADALLQQPNVTKIFSELRDFYDKNSSVQYKNRVQRDYRNIRSTMILCGTNVLRRADQAFLGERFVDFEMVISPRDEDEINAKMMERSIMLAMNMEIENPERKVWAATKGFVNHLMQRRPDLPPNDTQRSQIMNYAWLGAKMRSKVDRNMKGEMTFAPISELAPRLIGQMVKLYFSASMVAGDGHPGINKLIRKVILDILDESSLRFKVCSAIIERKRDQGWTRDELIDYTDIPKTTLTRELDDLLALEFIDRKKVDLGVPGRKAFRFSLKEKLHETLLRLHDGS